jgi:hypothetical protein
MVTKRMEIGDREILERAVEWIGCLLPPNSDYQIESGWRAVKGDKPQKWFRVFVRIQSDSADGTSCKSLTDAASRAFDRLAAKHPWLVAKLIDAGPMFPAPQEVTRST